MKRNPSTGRWAAIAWLLAVVFFGVSLFYAFNGNAFGWLVWQVLAYFWLYAAVNANVKQYKNRRNRSNP